MAGAVYITITIITGHTAEAAYTITTMITGGRAMYITGHGTMDGIMYGIDRIITGIIIGEFRL